MELKIGTMVDVQGRFFGRIIGTDESNEYLYEVRSLCGDITERCCETELYEPEEGLDEIDMMVLDSAGAYYGETDTETIRKMIIDELGKEGLRGYAIFSGGDEPEASHVCRIDCFGVYKSDIEAARQAEKDGLKLIPWKEQPKSCGLRSYRFIDTPENRKLLGISEED